MNNSEKIDSTKMLKISDVLPIPIGTRVQGLMTESDKEIVKGTVINNYNYFTMVKLDSGVNVGIPTVRFYLNDDYSFGRIGIIN